MAEGIDPAFLFYPADASEDTQFLNRLERGCYFDLLKAQKKHRRFSLELIKKVLGADFFTCWPSVESVLKKDGEFYYIAWVNEAIEKRAAHSEKQKKRIKDYWDKKKAESIPEPIQTNTTEPPKQEIGITLENENAIENAIENEFKNERKSKSEVFEEIFTDELFITDLARMHPRKNLQEGFEKCWMYHTQKPSPPVETWEWRQKLSTWLENTKLHDTTKNKQHARLQSIANGIATRYGSDSPNKKDG